MKAFLEEYGLVIVGVIVVAVLIGVASYNAANGKKSMNDTFDTFMQIGADSVEQASNEASNPNP